MTQIKTVSLTDNNSIVPYNAMFVYMCIKYVAKVHWVIDMTITAEVDVSVGCLLAHISTNITLYAHTE